MRCMLCSVQVFCFQYRSAFEPLEKLTSRRNILKGCALPVRCHRFAARAGDTIACREGKTQRAASLTQVMASVATSPRARL